MCLDFILFFSSGNTCWTVCVCVCVYNLLMENFFSSLVDCYQALEDLLVLNYPCIRSKPFKKIIYYFL